VKRRYLLWLLVALFAIVVISRLTEIRGLARVLRQGQWQWLLVAAALQMLYYVVYTGIFQVAFDLVGVKGSLRDYLPVMFGSVFVSLATPLGGAGGLALFLDDAGRRGQPPARAAAGIALVGLADIGMFFVVLMTGFAYLLLTGGLQPLALLAAALLFLLVIGLAALLGLGLRRPAWLQALLGWVERLVNRMAVLFRRPHLLEPGWATRQTTELVTAGEAIAANPGRLWRLFGISLSTHLLDLSCLYILFIAFRQPIQVGTLVAGYAVGILFWIVAITPQGLGAVEGAMTLAFTSLGVPAAKALVITLAFRGIGLWLPALVGLILLRQTRSLGQVPLRGHAELWTVRLPAILTALMGLTNLLSAVTPSLAGRVGMLRRAFPLEMQHGARLTTALLGFALLILAGNLWRRKRVAMLLTIVALLVSAFSHLAKGLDYEEAILAFLLAATLVVLRRHFHARSDPPSALQGLRMLAFALAFTLVYGAFGFYFFDRHLGRHFSLAEAIRQTVAMFIGIAGPSQLPLNRFGVYFANSIYIVGAVTLSYALIMLVRPVLVRHPATPAERARARTIVERYGRTSLAANTLLNDKHYFFTAGGSVLAYTVKGRTAIVLGDPIGPPEDAASAIKEFVQHCSGNDWQPAFFQTLPDYLPFYQAEGLSTIAIGQEAIIDLNSFTLSGRANHDLRSAHNRLVRLGYRAVYHAPPLSDRLVAELRAVSDEWLAMLGSSEKRFFLAWFDDDYIRNGPVMAVYGPDGSIRAFANIVSEFQANEITIELMRHVRNTDNGTMDFLFIRLFEWAKEQGYASFNMGLSSLAGVGTRSEDPVVERALHFIYEHMDEPYDFRGLFNYKNKFHPTWSPRYLAYPGPASLPAVAVAIARAYTGGGLLRALLTDWLGDVRPWRALSVRPGRERSRA